MMRQLTDEDALLMPAAVRRMLKSQCGGEWTRITVDQAGAYTVWNSPQQAASRATVAPPAPAPTQPAPAPPVKPERARATKPATKPAAKPQPAPPAPNVRDAEIRALKHLFGSRAATEQPGVRVISAHRDEWEDPAIWSGDPTEIDWSQYDVDAVEVSAVRLRDRLLGGLPDELPFKFLPDVLALYGMDLQIMEDALRHPQKVEVRPETRTKKYPVLAFFRGDVVVILGMRVPAAPMVIAAYAVPKLGPDASRGPIGKVGGGGAKREGGLPRNVGAEIRALRLAGAEVLNDPTASSVEVTYKGQNLGKITVGPASRATVESDYQRMIRKIHAIDQRQTG